MAKKVSKSTELSNPSSIPAHLLDIPTEDRGMELLKDYIVPPRLKIVQPTSGAPFDEMFGAGDVVLIPSMTLVAPVDGKTGAPFTFVPLFFFPEWIVVNPLETRQSLQMIRDRTFDPNSDIAARSRDPKTRDFICPEMPADSHGKALLCSHVETLNWIILIQQESLMEMPCLINFRGAEHSRGRNFSNLLQMRRTAIFGCKFECHTQLRSNVKGKWFGFDISNPEVAEDRWVQDVNLFNEYKGLYEEYKRHHEEQTLKVEYEDVVVPEDGEEDSDSQDSNVEF